MQSKIFAVAVAALSLSSVQGASVPRQITISAGTIVLPSLTFDPKQFLPQQNAFQTLDLLRDDIAKTAALVSLLTNSTTTNVLTTAAQANQVLGQVGTNVANIVTKVTGLADIIQGAIPSVPSATPSAPATNTPDIGGAAEDVVRQAQVLARAITAQLDILKKQASTLNGLLLIPTLATAQASLATVLLTIGTISTLALNTAASATANILAIVDRVRNAQVKLNPVLIIGLQPDIIF
ncbi:uncharacterized protein ColSpa_10000 [Colletotrichum spaethianum]|uniref:Cell wall protein n=1 Tax=Colletotrichum spaethianum TaxID=700344 RepID=A0AA37PCS5_9PEZI|nr:uncharacterized protein ColSpa_10000 [Colletotrichum spaethianum]GKT49819.1 hypothetical protein ColSpa_10000 [Colletotrichum spaethianum]